MKRFRIFDILILAVVWILLREYFSIATAFIGLAVGAGCLWFYNKYLPLQEIRNINFFRLTLFLFYVIGQIYFAGFFVIKVILTGGKVDVVDVKTKLTNDTLRVILADSVTLTPGSILLNIKDDTLTLLWLREKSDNRDMSVADGVLKGRLENQLLKVQK